MCLAWDLNINSPSGPTHTLQTLSQRCLSAESVVWGWSGVPAPEYRLSSHSWRYTFKCKYLKHISGGIYENIHLPQTRFHSFKYSPVESKKDEISLVVESGDLSTQKLGVLRKECSEHPADAVSQTCGEVIEDHLGMVISWILASSLK